MAGGTITLRGVGKEDIPDILDYWFNPANRDYHMKRGSDPATFLSAEREAAAYARTAETPLAERSSTTSVVLLDGKPIGHVLLNHFNDPEKCRMHFHVWRHRMPAGDALPLISRIARESVRHFFETLPVQQITGDIAVANKPANFVLKRLGFTPSETLMCSYLGDSQLYNRYKFNREDFVAPQARSTPPRNTAGPRP